MIQEISTRENDENAYRNISNMEKIHGKEIEKPVVSHVVALCSGGVGVDATALSLQKSMNPITVIIQLCKMLLARWILAYFVVTFAEDVKTQQDLSKRSERTYQSSK